MAEIKNNIDKFFSDLSSGATWNVGVSIARKNALPLDNTSVFKSYTELTTYVANGMSYMGQPVAVVNEDGSVDFYVLDANKNPQEVGKATTGDNNSIVLDDGVLKLLGFDDAPEGAQLSKVNGKLKWELPDTTTAEGQDAAIKAIQAILNGTTGENPTDGLIKKVADNTDAIDKNTKAIAVLNGDATKEGSVAYQIAQIVGGAGESFDTLKEIADWIAEHPTDAAEYNTRITANEEAIEELETLVGTTAVATQIANKVQEALFVEGVEKYALASALTALTGKVTTVEGKVTTIENQLTADPLHSHSNKTELDKVAAGDVAKWNEAANKADTVTNAIAEQPLHTHTNKNVLDGITADKITAWNSAEENAKTHTETYAATKAQGSLADTALQNVTVLGKSLSKSGETTVSVDDAKTALGLKSAAYTEASAYESAGAAKAVQGDTNHTVKEAYELAASKTTLADVNAAIAGAGHATAEELSAHTGNATIHVTTDDKQKWNAAVVKLESLTGESLGGGTGTTGGIASMIKTEIEAYDTTTVQPAISEIETALDAITNESTGRLPAVEKVSSENAASITTINETISEHDTELETAKSDIETLKTASGTHALKSDVDSSLAAKADKTAYEATAATVAELKATVDSFFAEDAVIDDTVNTLKEIAEYIKNDETGASGLTSRIGAIEVKLDGVEKVSTAISTAVSAEETRALAAEAGLSGRLDNLESNKAGYATTGYVDSKASAAQTAAESFATTKVTELTNGAVKTNTDNIATNTASISTLTSTKADKGESYLKAETYTKAEVESLIANQTAWGSF